VSFKPLDLQINISQMNHVARAQSHETSEIRHMQQHESLIIHQEADKMAHTVEKTHKSENEESIVKEREKQLNLANKKKKKKQKKGEKRDKFGRIIHEIEPEIGEIGGKVDIIR